MLASHHVAWRGVAWRGVAWRGVTGSSVRVRGGEDEDRRDVLEELTGDRHDDHELGLQDNPASLPGARVCLYVCVCARAVNVRAIKHVRASERACASVPVRARACVCLCLCVLWCWYMCACGAV